MTTRIAVLEDDEAQLDLIRSVVVAMGFVCHCFRSGRDLLNELRRETFDLYVFDWGVPDLSGLELLKWVRSNVSKTVPVLFITNRIEERDVITALNAGADDYMSKPVRVQELLARLNAVLRRAYPSQRREINAFGDYVFHAALKVLSYRGVEIGLKSKEYKLAYVLFSRMDELLSRAYLMEVVWGVNADVNSRTLDTHISRLRVKLDLRPENGYLLTTVYGVGYRLSAVSDQMSIHPLKSSSP